MLTRAWRDALVQANRSGLPVTTRAKGGLSDLLQRQKVDVKILLMPVNYLF